ncbi:MAG: hypothetical protein ACKOEM_11975 [Planctomycetia bacterium]
MTSRIVLVTLSTLLAAVAFGCGRSTAGRHRVWGPVTCGGAPVVAGEILFTPDGSKQNGGPQGVATIRGGRFDTSGTRAPGVAGGAMIVRVAGALDARGSRVVTHEFAVDLPRTAHEFAIEIPASAATSSADSAEN